MKKLLISLLFLISFTAYSQVDSSDTEKVYFGYQTGFTDHQPIYGLTLQKQYCKYVQVETDFVYSQRMMGHKIQADYLQFMLMGKFGYFGNRFGVYGGYGFSLNPTVNHSNPENHTYMSFVPSVGGQLRILPKTVLELKAIYDCGLVPGFYNVKEGNWGEDYKNAMIMATLKFQLK